MGGLRGVGRAQERHEGNARADEVRGVALCGREAARWGRGARGVGRVKERDEQRARAVEVVGWLSVDGSRCGGGGGSEGAHMQRSPAGSAMLMDMDPPGGRGARSSGCVPEQSSSASSGVQTVVGTFGKRRK